MGDRAVFDLLSKQNFDLGELVNLLAEDPTRAKFVAKPHSRSCVW